MKRIVVIEDNEGISKLLELKLTRLGYEVVCFLNGAEGMEYLKTNTCDLLILDILLPGASGWEVLENTKVPTFVLTVKNQEEDIKRSFSNEYVIEHIQKPFKLEILSLLVSRYFASVA